MEFSLTKIGTILLGVFSFIKLAADTIFGKFLIWVSFGLLEHVINFIVKYYSFLGSACIIIIALKWTKNIYLLGLVGLLFFLFITFALKPIGIG